GDGSHRGVRFSREQLRELRYAGLLHDFGKVGVREQVLVKQKKLYTADLDIIKHRFAYLRQGADLEFERARAEILFNQGTGALDAALPALGSSRRAIRNRSSVTSPPS